MDFALRPWSTSDASDLRRAVATSPDLGHQLGDVDLRREEDCAAFIDAALTATEVRVPLAIWADGAVVGHVGLSHLDHFWRFF